MADDLTERRAARESRAAQDKAMYDAAHQLIEESGADTEFLEALAAAEAELAARPLTRSNVPGRPDTELHEALAAAEAEVAAARRSRSDPGRARAFRAEPNETIAAPTNVEDLSEES